MTEGEIDLGTNQLTEQPRKPLGLTSTEHGILNGLNETNSNEEEEKYTLIDNLRSKYPDNNIVRQQLDRYDGRSEYNRRLPEYTGAIISGDINKIKELQCWFRTNYPDM